MSTNRDMGKDGAGCITTERPLTIRKHDTHNVAREGVALSEINQTDIACALAYTCNPEKQTKIPEPTDAEDSLVVA